MTDSMLIGLVVVVLCGCVAPELAYRTRGRATDGVLAGLVSFAVSIIAWAVLR